MHLYSVLCTAASLLGVASTAKLSPGEISFHVLILILEWKFNWLVCRGSKLVWLFYVNPGPKMGWNIQGCLVQRQRAMVNPFYRLVYCWITSQKSGGWCWKRQSSFEGHVSYWKSQLFTLGWSTNETASWLFLEISRHLSSETDEKISVLPCKWTRTSLRLGMVTLSYLLTVRNCWLHIFCTLTDINQNQTLNLHSSLQAYM